MPSRCSALHFALAPTPPLRNLFIMRACFKQLMFIIALAAVFGCTRVTQAQSLKTNDLNLAKAGTLQVVTPADWTAKYIGMNQPDQEPMFDLHAPSNTLVI